MLVARNIMTTALVTVQPDASIRTAAHLLQINRVSGLPVVDEERRLIGVVSEYDFLRFLADGEQEKTVGELMQSDVVTVAEDTPIVEIAEILLRERFRRVVVTRESEVVGLVSRRDIIFTEGSLRHLPRLHAN